MSIYRYLWTDKRQGCRLWQCLRRKAKPYHRRLTAETRGRISDRVSIHERPVDVITQPTMKDVYHVDVTVINHQGRPVIIDTV